MTIAPALRLALSARIWEPGSIVKVPVGGVAPKSPTVIVMLPALPVVPPPGVSLL
jgi:hypothetical protein